MIRHFRLTLWVLLSDDLVIPYQRGFYDDLFYYLSTDALASFYNTVIMEILMTTSIVPNIALGMGVILIVTFACGSVKEIPCHNRPTAEYLARHYKNS